MSQDESRRSGNHEEQEDVEAHLRRAHANDEGTTEGEGDDDVEAHIHRTNVPKKH